MTRCFKIMFFEDKRSLIIFFLMLITFCCYILFFFHRSFTSDETGYLYQAKTLLYQGEYPRTWFSGRIIPILYYALWIMVFGTEIFFLRLMTVPIVILGAILWSYFIWSIHNDYVSLGAIGLHLFAPITLMLSTWTLFEPFSCLFMIISLNFIKKWVEERKLIWMITTGMSVGAGYLCKEDVITLAISIGIYLILILISDYKNNTDYQLKIAGLKNGVVNIASYIGGGLVFYIPRLILLGFTELDVSSVARSVDAQQKSGTGIITNPFGGTSIIKTFLSAGYALAFIGIIAIIIIIFAILNYRRGEFSFYQLKHVHWIVLGWMFFTTIMISVWTIQARYFYYYSIMIGMFLFLINNKKVFTCMLILCIVGNMYFFSLIGERYEYSDPEMTKLLLDTKDYIKDNIPVNSVIYTTYYLKNNVRFLLGEQEYRYFWIHHTNNTILPNNSGTSYYIIILELNPLFDVAMRESNIVNIAKGTETDIGVFRTVD